MIYFLIRKWVRAALFIYFGKIKVSNRNYLREKGPMLLACNHPNSFLDAIIMGALFKQPVYYLARGDAFKKKFVRKIFDKLKMIPIYRLSEGRENLSNNDETFERCQNILKQDGIVLIFSEGLCIHEWKLRPLKKGTARLALQAVNASNIGHQLKVMPVGLNYTSFQSIGKDIYINLGKPIHPFEQKDSSLSGQAILEFNQQLKGNLENLVLSEEKVRTIFLSTDLISKYILLVPGILGYIISVPVYLYAKSLAIKLNKGGVFYDSMLFGFLMILYPIYIFLISLVLYIFTGSIYIWLLMILAPLLAKAAILERRK